MIFELWEKALKNPAKKAEADQLKLLAEKAIKLLQSFQKVFPIGQPLTPIYRGWYQWLTGKPEAAIRTLQQGLEAALKFKMPYEEGSIRLKLASYSQANLSARKRNLWQAMEIFERMGARNELRLAQEEARKTGI